MQTLCVVLLLWFWLFFRFLAKAEKNEITEQEKRKNAKAAEKNEITEQEKRKNAKADERYVSGLCFAFLAGVALVQDASWLHNRGGSVELTFGKYDRGLNVAFKLRADTFAEERIRLYRPALESNVDISWYKGSDRIPLHRDDYLSFRSLFNLSEPLIRFENDEIFAYRYDKRPGEAGKYYDELYYNAVKQRLLQMDAKRVEENRNKGVKATPLQIDFDDSGLKIKF